MYFVFSCGHTLFLTIPSMHNNIVYVIHAVGPNQSSTEYFVDLEKQVIMNCEYNPSFKAWVPLSVVTKKRHTKGDKYQ